MKLVTVSKMREIEERADLDGLSYAEMMENAGRAVALAIRERVPAPGAVVAVLAGPGNNGGDGLVAARHLHEWGYDVRIYLWKREPDAEDDRPLQEVQELGLFLERYEDDPELERLKEMVHGCDVLVDALLGTGATGPLRGGAEVIVDAVTTEQLRQSERGDSPLENVTTPTRPRTPYPKPFIVAVDVPSGLDSDTGEIDERALTANLCVTFAHPKQGQFLFPGAAFIKELTVADIGTDPSLADDVSIALATPRSVKRLLPDRPPDAHKGTFGKVLIVAGSINYVGAPGLCAEAAYRIGAGLVTLAVPGAIHNALASKLAEATYLLLPQDMGVLTAQAVPVLAEHVEEFTVMLLGPGLGQEEQTLEFIKTLLERHRQTSRRAIGFTAQQGQQPAEFALPPLVIDADGLNLLAKINNWWERIPRNTVVTPHPGEMARLLESDVDSVNADRVATAQRAAEAWNCTVVLKGAFTVVAFPGKETMVIPFAEAALATAGTGDVLAGTIAGLMAQGRTEYEAAVCGAFVHGLAGALWREQFGEAGMLAGNLATLLPRALDSLRQQ